MRRAAVKICDWPDIIIYIIPVSAQEHHVRDDMRERTCSGQISRPNVKYWEADRRDIVLTGGAAVLSVTQLPTSPGLWMIRKYKMKRMN